MCTPWPGTPTTCTVEQMAAVITELAPWWGQLSPAAVAQFVARVIRVLNPPPDPRTRRGRRVRGPVAVVRPDRGLGGPGRGAAPPGGRGGDRRDRRVRRTVALPKPTTSRRPPAARTGWSPWSTPPTPPGPIPTRGGLPVSVSVTLDSTALGRPGVDHLPRAHPHRRGATVHRLRRDWSPRSWSTPGAAPTPSPNSCPPPARHGRRRRRQHRPGRPTRAPTRRPTGRAPSGALRGGPDRGPGHDPARDPDPPGRRTHRPHRHPRPTPGPGRPRQGLHHPRLRDPGRSLPNPPRHRLGRRREHRPAQPGPALLGTSPPSRPRHVDHHPHDRRPPRPPPEPGAPPGTPWPANHNAPWTITRTPRTRWRL